ncbi:gp19 [Salmonella enterica subsp. enterica serovar Typhi]|nr:gp19 [Salmonella enterica subsp. enterica serovar Typhi]
MPVSRYLCIFINVGLGEGSALPVGVPVPWPSATPPTGWLKCNGAAFSAEEYPELAKVYPTNKLPDLRGEFIRGWDDGRGVDAGRQLLSSQGDAIRNIEGFADGGIGMSFDAIRGAFYDAGTRSARMPNNTTDIGKTDDLGFDASRVVPTANENRPVTRCRILRPSLSSFQTTSVSPADSVLSSFFSPGLSDLVPLILSSKIRSHPAQLSALRCKSVFWSFVDTRT